MFVRDGSDNDQHIRVLFLILLSGFTETLDIKNKYRYFRLEQYISKQGKVGQIGVIYFEVGQSGLYLKIFIPSVLAFKFNHSKSIEILIFKVSQLRDQQNQVKLHSINSHLTKQALYFNTVSVILSLFCSSRKVTSKNLLLVSCLAESKLADNQQKFDSRATSVLYMLNDWL